MSEYHIEPIRDNAEIKGALRNGQNGPNNPKQPNGSLSKEMAAFSRVLDRLKLFWTSHMSV